MTPEEVMKRRAETAEIALRLSQQHVATLEARLNEAREAIKRYLYALSVNNGTDGPDDRAAALDNLASISDTEGALEMEPQGEDSIYGPPPNYANPLADDEGGDK